MTILEPQRTLSDSVLEIRGDGKAGGGLLLAFQSLASLLVTDPGIHVQEWPFFSSARRGAGIRSFLRVSRHPITAACEVTRPGLAVLMDEAAAKSVDFAEGVPPGGGYVLNTRRTPEECARHFRLSGRVHTVPGEDLGTRFLKAPIGNAAVYVAMARAIGGFSDEAVIEGFLRSLRKRHVPDVILERNRQVLDATPAAIRSGEFDLADPTDHRPAAFAGYGDLPVGAQTPLRLSKGNRAADFAPTGVRLRFEDPALACTGCALCITNCPEGIIRFQRDDERGVLVTGLDQNQFCKQCLECVAICPEHLFQQVPFEELWPEEEKVS
jgi:2-oxoacid:acceptor oxidoreductase gamma subunit (pyruvate/2-ketoisovalerate family)